MSKHKKANINTLADESKYSNTQSEKHCKKKKIGLTKGVGTLFRTSFRTELDLIALAATKANIMISLNGFIVSALMISGGFIYVATPSFLIPATLFLFTSAISIYFALNAASPNVTPTHTRKFSWIKNIFTRKNNLCRFNHYYNSDQSFIDEESNILIYEDRSKLTKSDYLERMHELLGNQELIYEKMSDQLYWLGIIAAKKFMMLRASYFVFRWGIVLSVMSLLSIKTYEYLLPQPTPVAVKVSNVGISEFKNIYEPSAVQQLQDGRLVIVEDESSRALRVVEFLPDGSISENNLRNNFLLKSFNRKLSDLEGLAMDSSGYIYAITSHSRTEKGKRKKARELILRFKIVGDKVVDIGIYTNLVNNLKRTGILDSVLGKINDKNINFDEINIEALSFDKDQNKLFIGFRQPLIDGKSMLITITNPVGIFERNEQAKLSSKVVLLDLDGGGIRSLVYDTHLKGYLLSNEVKGKNGKLKSQLWFWKGNPNQVPERINLPGIIDLKNVESIAPVIVNGEQRILLLSDDGKFKKKKGAHYMILEYDKLLN